MKTDNVFKTHPKLKSYHKTSDGTPFFQESDAKTHAKGLKDKTIETVVNTDLIEVVVDDEAGTDTKSTTPAKKKAAPRKKAAKKPAAPKEETLKKETPKVEDKKEDNEPKQD